MSKNPYAVKIFKFIYKIFENYLVRLTFNLKNSYDFNLFCEKCMRYAGVHVTEWVSKVLVLRVQGSAK